MRVAVATAEAERRRAALDERVEAKVAALETQHASARAVGLDAGVRYDEVRHQLQAAVIRLRDLEEGAKRRRYVLVGQHDGTDDIVEGERLRAQRLEREAKRLHAERTAAGERSQRLGPLVERARQAVESGEAATWTVRLVLDPRPEDVVSALDAVRQQIAGVEAAVVALTRSPVPEDEAVERIKGWVGRLAAQYKPPVDIFRDGDFTGHEEWSLFIPPPDLLRGSPHFPAFLATLFGDQLTKFFLRRLRESPPTAEPIASVERPSRRAALQAQLDELVVAEEALVMHGEADGLTIERRADADIKIVLTTVLADGAG